MTLSEKNAPLEKVLNAISLQTGVNFFGESTWAQVAHKVTISVKDMPYTEALVICFKGQPLRYEMVGGGVSIHVNKSKDFILKGYVLNEKQEPVPGATVVSKGTGKVSTAFTDELGGFSIFLGRQDTSIVISSVSYETKEIAYTGQPEINVQIKTRVVELAEAVVGPVHTGYYDVPKDRATGSFSQVPNAVIERRVSTSIMDRLDGVTSSLLANKNIVQGQNQSSITIRGRSTIFGNPDPLIVVDNFPYSGDINNINPEDIESVTVLKDAAAASIWGAFSGNGVIVMTTKKGKYNQKPKWNFTTSLTVGAKPNLYYQPILSSKDYIEVEKYLYSLGYYSAAVNDPSHPTLSPAVEILLAGNNVQNRLDSLGNINTRTDLNKYFYHPSVNQQYALNFGGGGKRDHYFVSAGFNKDVSNLVRNQYDRTTIDASNTWSIIPKKLEWNTDFTWTWSEGWNNNSGIIFSSYPYLKLNDEKGNATAIPFRYRTGFVDTVGEGKLLDWHYRPLDELRNANDKISLTDIRFYTGVRYAIWNGFSANIHYQYQHGKRDEKNLQSLQTYPTRDIINSYAQPDTSGGYDWPVPLGGILDQGISRYDANNLRLQLNYDHVFSSDHMLNALAGWELRDVEGHIDVTRLYGYDGKNGIPVNYDSAYYQYFSGSVAKIPNPDQHYATSDRFLSYYANAAYAYRQRYILSASARRDESNLFGVNSNQKGVPLWSVGAAWELSREDFYNVSWLPYLKLRGTQGYNGNVDKSVSAFTTAQLYDTENGYGEPFSSIVNPPNPSLRWEKIGIFNVGIDFAGRNNRIAGTLEYYTKSGKDLIGRSVMDPTTGVTSFTGNTANMALHGFDIVLHTRNLTGTLKWNNDFLLSYTKDKVTHYEDSLPSVTGYFNATSLNPLVGHPLYSIYALKWSGLDPNSGDPLGQVDGHSDTSYGRILNASVSSLLYKGPANPTFFGSWRNAFDWKQFELSFNIVFKFGYYFRRNSINYYGLYNGVSEGSPDYDYRWQKPGDEKITNVPSRPSKATGNRDDFYRYSEVLIEKGDHVRWQDIRISYDMPKKVYPKLPVQAIRFYLYANNIGIIWRANHRDVDPDYANINSFPNPRTLALGCKLEF